MESSEQLMSELAWVRRLARALLHDDAAADDVAQDAWLVAATARPDEDRPLRPWLGAVARKLVHTRRRGGARRDEREAAYEGQPPPTPADLIERVELQRMVAGEVLALAEPYRSTLLLHFYEGLSSAQIARKLDIPDGTVRRRLKTALDQLRARLERRDRNWLAALAPLVGAPTKGFVMKKMIAAGLVLALLIGGAVAWRAHRTASAPVRASAPTTPPSPPAPMRVEPTRIPAYATQTGVAPRRIAGRVLAAGVPVAGATVRLGPKVTEFLYPLLAEVTTGPDGAFDFGMQPAARFEVSAQANGYTPVTRAVSNADPRAHDDRIELALDICRAKVSGMVVDASGGPIAQARVTVDGLAGADSDASGHYAMCLAMMEGAPTPDARLTVRADGYGTLTTLISYIDGQRQDFTLTPEAILVGRVTTTDDRPVAGARVVANADPMERPHRLAPGWAETDDDGRFRMTGLAAGKYQLAGSAGGLGSSTASLEIVRATATSEVVLVLAPRAQITGRVVSGGAPVAGASVAVDGARWVFSQLDGSFTLDGVSFGKREISVVRGPDAPPIPTATRVVVDRAQIDGIVVEIPPGATVRGRVLRKGVPVAGANAIYLLPGRTAIAMSDASGNYVFDGVPEGDGQVYAWSPRAKAFMAPVPVHAIAGEVVQDLELGLAGEIQGAVVDTLGAPVAAAYVRWSTADGGDTCEAMTDARGNFACAMLAGGEYHPLVAPSPDTGQPLLLAEPPAITVASDGVTSGVRLVVDNARLAIRGTVIDDTGAVVADAHIEAIGRGYPVRGDLRSVLADASGGFQIDDLAPGVYNLHAHAADGSEAELFDVAAGTTNAKIVLARAGAIAGTLVGFASKPRVDLSTTAADLRLGGTAVVDGATFSQIGLPVGHYTVTAHTPSQRATAEVDIAPGQTARVELRP